ncbi:MAG TPA: Arc family DNA-binding protein [Syntrophomonadaceae bacterium]|nr:Arc family DNA-binding protein [Syntrophomonadaceae bacterium]
MAQKKRFLLRIDPSLYDDLQRWADDEYRSVNAHIEYLLRDALKKAGRLSKSSQPDTTKDPPP